MWVAAALGSLWGCSALDTGGDAIPPAPVTATALPLVGARTPPAKHSRHRPGGGFCDDPCATDNGGCDPLTACTSIGGRHRACGPCPAGYAGTGEAGCADVDECLADNGGCGAGTVCANLPGDHACRALSFAVTGYGVPPRSGSLAMGDWNGDGDLDLAATNSDAATVDVFLGAGDGTFAAPFEIPVGNTPEFVGAGDLNGDGSLDLVVANFGGDDVTVLLNRGDGTFADGTSFPAGRRPEWLALADLNDDGTIDVAVAGASGASVLYGDGAGALAAAVNVWPTASRGLTAGDVDGDGKADLVVGGEGGGDRAVHVFINQGGGALATPADYPATGFGSARSLVLGDLNADGRPDLALVDNDLVEVLLNDGTGAFGPAARYFASKNTESVAIGDLNGDGRPDLAVANSGAANLTVLPNLGDGTFAAGTNFTVGPPFGAPISIRMGDLDGDGLPDLAVTNPVRVFLNTSRR